MIFWFHFSLLWLVDSHISSADHKGGNDKKIAPKGANDIKLINTGKILENDKMVGQCRVPFGDLSKAVITMHVVAQPSVAKVKTEKEEDEVPRKNLYPCSIL
ncbi:hypothetical protein ES288_A07G271700v1 [Gossypium darwinii]|uniref:UBL3-like ubiquitin domain-containing protein n=1 Tax=Gossypium darwinii TaxID=34276 RepID=A0A5D2G219_GOSDA|nr:hypothetical protein ES288_A07G271700v1 [Gossypium darwinii]